MWCPSYLLFLLLSWSKGSPISGEVRQAAGMTGADYQDEPVVERALPQGGCLLKIMRFYFKYPLLRQIADFGTSRLKKIVDPLINLWFKTSAGSYGMPIVCKAIQEWNQNNDRLEKKRKKKGWFGRRK